jgi:AraC-like DNA-binding protein
MSAKLERIPYEDGGGFRAAFINDKGGFWHFHPEYELVLNLKSYGTRIIGDSVELFEHYDMTFIASNIPHCWNQFKQNGIVPGNHGIVCHFKEDGFGHQFLSQTEMLGLRKLLKRAERGIIFSKDDARKAESHLRNMIDNAGMKKMIGFFNLLDLLIEAKGTRPILSDKYIHDFDHRGNERMTNVYGYIRENYQNQITLEEVAGIANMSTYAFSRYFSKNCGMGLIEYINQVRLNKSCYYLRETDRQVQDIAFECGFSSISNFNKQFTKSKGLSPREYRNKFQQALK